MTRQNELAESVKRSLERLTDSASSFCQIMQRAS